MDWNHGETYSDEYVPALVDQEAEAYFRTLPGHIQNRIDAMKHRPATVSDMKRAAENIRKIY